MVKTSSITKPRTRGTKRLHWALPETGYVRERELLAHVLPVSASTLARMVKRGKFPAGVKLAPRITGWRAEDVRMWLAAPSEYRANRATQEG